MALWFFNKVVWFVLAAMLEGILLPSNMAAKTTFFLYLVKRFIVSLRCSVNVTTSSFQHFPWSLSVKFVFRKRWLIILKIIFWSRDQPRTYWFKENGAGLKKQITIILFKIWPTNRFSKKISYNFHFHKNDVKWPLSANGLLPDWDWAWSDGTKAANWGSRKGYLCERFFFFLPSYISHLSMHLEKSRRLSVLWTIWNFSMISAEKKCQDHLIFVITVEWISPVKHRVQKRWPK